MFCKNAGEGGTGFLGAIFVIGSDKDNMLAFTGAGSAFVSELREGGQ